MLLTQAESEALLLSLKVSTVAVAAALPFALGAAFLLARSRFPGKTFVDGILHLPLVLPPVVVGYLLLITLGTREPVGAWLLLHLGIRLAFTWKGAAVAAGLITFPFQLRAIRLALEGLDRGLSEAAETLGAGPFDRFINLVLPLALPGIVAGAIITFVSNIPGETQTLPLAIYSAIQTAGGEVEAARLSALSIGLALIGLTLAEIADRRVRTLIGQ